MIVGSFHGVDERGRRVAGADRMTIEEVVREVMVREHGDVLRAALDVVCAELMEGEVSELVGAELGERRPEDRMTHRNGYRPREWQTRAGTVELQIPKLRRGSYFPSFSRTTPALRAGAAGGHPAGLCVVSRRVASTSSSRASGCACPRAR
jgi:hypothetical protein